MRRLFATLYCLTVIVISASAQSTEMPTRVAVLDFGETPFSKLATDKVRTAFRSTRIQLIDRDLSRAAALGVGYTGSLNLSLPEARNLGAAIETDFYIIGDAQALRRSSSQSPVYYESYASIFVISSRTGRLLFWERPSFRADASKAAEEKLVNELGTGEIVQRCLNAIRQALKDERDERVVAVEANAPIIEEAPDDDSTAVAQGLRLPRPYRRLRPTYPETAARAEAEATVDVVVDVGADGEVSKVQVARWAGFGLDDTTVATVRQMHFFPAMRNGTPIPMRVLLRYNFRKPTQ